MQHGRNRLHKPTGMIRFKVRTQFVFEHKGCQRRVVVAQQKLYPLRVTLQQGSRAQSQDLRTACRSIHKTCSMFTSQSRHRISLRFYTAFRNRFILQIQLVCRRSVGNTTTRKGCVRNVNGHGSRLQPKRNISIIKARNETHSDGQKRNSHD